MQASVLRERWNNERKPEAEILNEQIQVTQMAANLAFQKVAKMPRQELAVHLNCMTKEEIVLPFRVRVQVLQRRGEDLMGDFIAARTPGDKEELSKKLADAVCIWLPCGPVDEENIRAADLWGSVMESVRARERRGLLAECDVQKELGTYAEASREIFFHPEQRVPGRQVGWLASGTCAWGGASVATRQLGQRHRAYSSIIAPRVQGPRLGLCNPQRIQDAPCSVPVGRTWQRPCSKPSPTTPSLTASRSPGRKPRSCCRFSRRF